MVASVRSILLASRRCSPALVSNAGRFQLVYHRLARWAVPRSGTVLDNLSIARTSSARLASRRGVFRVRTLGRCAGRIEEMCQRTARAVVKPADNIKQSSGIHRCNTTAATSRYRRARS